MIANNSYAAAHLGSALRMARQVSFLTVHFAASKASRARRNSRFTSISRGYLPDAETEHETPWRFAKANKKRPSEKAARQALVGSWLKEALGAVSNCRRAPFDRCSA